MKQTIALVVAAGRGHRFGGELPKQYFQLNGCAVLRHTVMVFQKHPKVSSVRVVIHPDDLPLYETAIEGLDLDPPIWGGASRQESVRLGLEQLRHAPPDMVLIHDGARPYVTDALISRVIDGLDSSCAVIPALALTDTIKRVVEDKIIATENRAELWRVQTPQGFRFSDILAAHRQLEGQSLTDDSAVCETVGMDVLKVDGDEANRKITTPQDIVQDQQGAAPMETRTGLGFDVHRFTTGNTVVLCGISIPSAQALEGHSDADVGLHALTDALLGAIGENDIGHFFPPTEARWRGAPSDLFVRHAVKMIHEKGGKISNVDMTIICETPKIGPHRIQMRDRVAEIMNVSAARVNVKATTTEQLGFTGRREGIAAQVIATVQLPGFS